MDAPPPPAVTVLVTFSRLCYWRRGGVGEEQRLGGHVGFEGRRPADEGPPPPVRPDAAVAVLPRQAGGGGGPVTAAVGVHPGKKVRVLPPPLVEAVVARRGVAPSAPTTAHLDERVALGEVSIGGLPPTRSLRDHLLLQRSGGGGRAGRGDGGGGGGVVGAGGGGGGAGGGGVLSGQCGGGGAAVRRRLSPLVVLPAVVVVVVAMVMASAGVVGAGVSVEAGVVMRRRELLVGGQGGPGEQGAGGGGGEDLDASGPRGADLVDVFEQLVQRRHVRRRLGEGLIGVVVWGGSASCRLSLLTQDPPVLGEVQRGRGGARPTGRPVAQVVVTVMSEGKHLLSHRVPHKGHEARTGP